MKKYTDEDLVRLYISTQKNEYFDSLYTRYCDKVYRKCLSFSKDSSLAEDFCHDVFLRVITKLGLFREEAKFSTWLYAITYNYCITQTKNKRRTEPFVDDIYEYTPDFTEENDADIAEMEVKGLARSLAMLTTEEQNILLLKHQDELSIRDIASILELSESAVKMRLKRAKDKLRKYYIDGFAFWLIVITKILATLKWPFN